jgi:nitrate reductase alpha subunit
MFREDKNQTTVAGCARGQHIVENPQRAKAYKSDRGKEWPLCAPPGKEACEIIAAAHVHTIKKYGPDGWPASPIRRCRWVSHAAVGTLREP